MICFLFAVNIMTPMYPDKILYVSCEFYNCREFIEKDGGAVE